MAGNLGVFMHYAGDLNEEIGLGVSTHESIVILLSKSCLSDVIDIKHTLMHISTLINKNAIYYILV